MNDDLDAWISLVHRPGLGRGAARKLLAAFGSAGAVLEAPAAAVRAVAGAASSALLDKRDDEHVQYMVRVREWLGADPARRVLTLGDSGYPPALLQSADPPLILYVAGDANILQGKALAIVGSRQATAQGLLNARAFARDLARQGWVIVSGLAAGIDAAAHEGALEGGGPTIAVVGTGLDQVYPKSNAVLAQRIREQGVMVSEYALGTPPLATNFPQRNRIIATLSQGTLVVEATLQSGSLITARLAGEAGREVFAIPGSIHSPQSRGCHALLRQGAKLVETSMDLMDELSASSAVHPPRGADGVPPEPADLREPTGDAILHALGYEPVTLDALLSRCGWPVARLSARLLELELEGMVARLPGGLYQRIQNA